MESEDVIGQPQTLAAGPSLIQAEEWVDGATNKELHAAQEHPDPSWPEASGCSWEAEHRHSRCPGEDQACGD